jgi:hypothetical protein
VKKILLSKMWFHSRQIGDKIFTVRFEDGERIEEKNMSDDDLQEFHKQWKRDWTPSLTDEVIKKTIYGDKVPATRMYLSPMEIEEYTLVWSEDSGLDRSQ